MKNFYKTSFQITENIGNNIFCFDRIEKAEIYIPSLISVQIEKFTSNITNYLKAGENPVFHEEKNGKVIQYKGLNNFLEIKSDNQTIYIVDNHNHALYFWYKEYFEGNISKGSELIHIDQHTDMNDNKFVIASKTKQSITIEDIFEFTNYNCNVGDFIKPAIEEGLISKITQINTEYSLLNIQTSSIGWVNSNLKKIDILDIDLDFRAPGMSIAEYNKTIDIARKLIQNSRIVTISTSPYFLDQNLAINIIQDLFLNI